GPGPVILCAASASAIRLEAYEGGDEPFLLARRLPGVPVVVGAHRYEAGRHAVERFGVSAIVLDDGFQHRTLAKDLEIVMARARAPWGSARLLPGGPLREPLAALARSRPASRGSPITTGTRARRWPRSSSAPSPRRPSAS